MVKNVRGVFANNEWKIIPYCIYNNVTVNAVLDNNGKLALCYDPIMKNKCAMFFINGDKNYQNITYRTMKMDVFIKEAQEQKADAIDICNSSSCYVSSYGIKPKNNIDGFKKSNFLRFLHHHPELNDKYSFLMEDGILVNRDSDIGVVSLTELNRLLDSRVSRELKMFLAECGVDSFEELIDLVEKGRSLLEKN